MQNYQGTIDILNNLIEICKDGEEGFFKSAEITKDLKIQAFLYQRSNEAKVGICELQSLVRDLGGVAASSSSMGGYIHRKWIDLKISIMMDDSLAILDELYRIGEIAQIAFRSALSQELSPRAVLVVLRQLDNIEKNQEKIRHLHDVTNTEGESIV